MSFQMLSGEREWLSTIVDNLADDTRKLIYADWLQDHNDERAHFLRSFVTASRSVNHGDFPETDGLPEEWLELIGLRIVEQLAVKNRPELKSRLLPLARPALQFQENAESVDDKEIPIGSSKIGGFPDLPAGFAWPRGGDCSAIYNDDTAGEERLAGFMAQINLKEIANTLATRDLPQDGLLSFFCFQDIENDDPDKVGIMVAFFPSTDGLARKEPPEQLTDGNTTIPPLRFLFEEILDLPVSGGPWKADIGEVGFYDTYSEVLYHFDHFWNFLGYARATSGDDPTPSKLSRHLIVLKNAAGCVMHIQLMHQELVNRRFDKCTLNWVDFD